MMILTLVVFQKLPVSLALGIKSVARSGTPSHTMTSPIVVFQRLPVSLALGIKSAVRSGTP
jgi:hypothetical protein